MLTNIEVQAYNAHATMCRNLSNHLEKIDWEQRRYEIAKDVYCAYIISNAIRNLTPTQMAENAVLRADALIEELKKKD